MAQNSDNVIINKDSGRRAGKAVLICHYLFDKLWMAGDKQIPNGILEKDEVKQIEEVKEIVEVKPEVSPKEMDDRIVEAFLRCWLELIKPEPGQFPMEPSTFATYLNQY